MRIFGLAIAVATLAQAGEQAVLHNGFRIAAERHEVSGNLLRLHTRDGVIEIERRAVAAIEMEEAVATAAPAAPATQPAAPAVAPAPPAGAQDPRQLLDQAAEKYGLPRAFLHSVARTESAYQPKAVSHKGAIGVMQLMPGTAAQLGADPHDPAQNIDAGARHLRDLLVEYEGSSHKALSAYNAGAGAVEKYNGVPPYRETRGYVRKVLETYQKLAEK